MFARTQRLLLRPGFPEDAPALAAAIADEAIVRNLAISALAVSHARRRGLSRRARAIRCCPRLLIFERTDAEPQLIGSCGLGRRPSGAVEMGYWIARSYWGRGFATEACTALIEIARALGLEQPRRLALHRQSRLGAGAREARLRTARLDRPADELRARHGSTRRG